MTQKEFAWDLASLLSQVARLPCQAHERKLLTALCRIYMRLRDHHCDDSYVVGEDGTVAIEPSKKEIADALHASPTTVKRLLRQVKDGGMFVRVAESQWRTHFYEIDFPAIFSAELAPLAPVQGGHDPGSGGPRRGVRGANLQPRSCRFGPGGPPPGPPPEGGQTGISGGPNRVSTGAKQGGQGGHSMESIDPSSIPNPLLPDNSYSKQSMESGGGSSGFSEKRIWAGLTKADFYEPERMQRRYEQLVESGLAQSSEVDRRTFFALLVYVRRAPKIRNRFGLLVKSCRAPDKYGQTWRDKPADQDHIEAAKIIRQFDAMSLPVEDDDQDVVDDGPIVLDHEARERLRRGYQEALEQLDK